MTLETLLAERAIYRALVHFARAMDERDWDALTALTTDDISADLGAGSLDGRAALVANMRAFLDDCGPTQHLLGNVLIEVEGERASSRAYVSDMHLGQGERAHLTFSTLGDYHDQWRRQDDVWRMCHRRKLNRAHLGDIRVLGAGPAGWND
ncbi:nuclear transport factor 2 family protein [Parahaliea mediterranea]|uniref:nuclear transport factor 2 family protein n=1 Tax=Parahaliea mediterranea TaxID=651086 RepID=UPI000E2EE7D5|nr:nuclear transport factor 2 family protein [Parahaliea mediterranea]